MEYKLKVLGNRPANLQERDFFGLLKKAEAIETYLEDHFETINEKNNMIALFGDWGSGKTTIQRYLEQKLDPNLYESVFFEAWEHEKDSNLALSLCHCLANKSSDKKLLRKFISEANVVLGGLVSALTIKTPSVPGIPELEFSGREILEGSKKAKEDIEKEMSAYQKNKRFKASFSRIEKNILKQSKRKKIIVFIDDLDRCEPENVLNLLSAIKLFFTFGRQIVFFCGLDKEAVKSAVTTKYGSAIKAEEYLEKIFDTSFSVPKTASLKPLIHHYFNVNGDAFDAPVIIEKFLKSIEFTNPRHLKKVFDKFEIIRSFKNSNKLCAEYKMLIPDILIEGRGNTTDTIFTLYFIILYEFYYDKFSEIENYEGKMQAYANRLHQEFNSKRSQSTNFPEIFMELSKQLVIINRNTKTFSQIIGEGLLKFYSIFTPKEGWIISSISNIDPAYFVEQFKNDKPKILVNFCTYMLGNSNIVNSHSQNYKLGNYFEMAKTLL